MAASDKKKVGIRVMAGSLLSRIVRRGFFRLVLLLFLLGFVLPFGTLRALANSHVANSALDRVIENVFDSVVADVTWDRDLTEITGPSLDLTGRITLHNVRIARHAGVTRHPERGSLEYDFLNIPKVEVRYDLKRLPQLPVTLVTLEGGLTLYFNIYRGQWLDEDLFRSTDTPGETPSLPQIILGESAQVNLRADGILTPPEQLIEDDNWYRFSLDDLSLLPTTTGPNIYQIGGVIEGRRFGRYLLGGNIERTAQHAEVNFRTADPIRFDSAFAAVLAPDVRRTVDQFSINAERTTVRGSLRFEAGRDLQFAANLDAQDGSAVYVGFPARVTDVSADIQVRNNNIYVEATGQRDGAHVQVSVRADSVGTINETLQVNVNIRDLLIDERLRLALLPARLQPDNLDFETGLPIPEDEFDPRYDAFVPGYPEWAGPPPWEGGLTYPELDDIFPFITRAFTPMGMANFELRVDSEVRGFDPETGERNKDETLRFKVFIRDATACFTGIPEDDGIGVPIPVHNAYGVVEGFRAPGAPARYEVRGYTQNELDALGSEAAGDMVAHGRTGLAATLQSPGERIYVHAVYVDDQTAGRRPRLTLNVSTDGVDFNRRLERRLPPRVREVIEPFAPEGKVDIDSAQLHIIPDGTEDVVYQFALAAKGVAAQYQFPGAEEPARFSDAQGTIRVNSRGNVVELVNLRGRLANSPVLLGLEYRDGAIPSLSLESNDFRVTPDLRAVLPSDMGEILNRFQPRGFISMRIDGHRDTDEPDFTRADITFQAGTGDRSGSVRFDGFPYTITDVQGRLFATVTPNLVEVMVREFRGRGMEDPVTGRRASVEINGHVLMPRDPEDMVAVANPSDEHENSEANGDEDFDDGLEAVLEDAALPILDLDIRATHLPVDSVLLAAMTQVLRDDDADDPDEDPAVIQFAEDLNVRGTVGVVGRLVSDADGEFDWRFEVLLEGPSVRFEHFAVPISDLQGSVVIDQREVSLRNVEGNAETGKVTVHDAGFTPERGWWIMLSGRQMSFHESPSLRRALPGALQEQFERIQPRGKFDIDIELTGMDDFMYYNVALDTYETDVNLGLEFDAMTARFDIEGAIEGLRQEDAEPSQRLNGKVYVHEAFFKDARFNDVTSSVQYFGERLEFPNLRGYFYDGWIKGRFGTREGAYSGEIVIRGADIGKLGKTAFPDAGELMGAMDAEVRFHSWEDSQGQIGRGRIDIQPFDRSSDDPARNTCRLAPVPLFNEIFRVTGSEQNFDEGHVYFWIGPDRITIRQMDFVSNSARVETFGGDDENYIMHGTAQMRLKLFFTLAPRSPLPLPLVQDVLDLLKQILFPLYVTGTLNEPSVEPFSLSVRDIERAQDPFPRRPRGG
jgi:hypothetical protein